MDERMREVMIENERLHAEAIQLQARAVEAALEKLTQLYAEERQEDHTTKPSPRAVALKKARDEVWYVGHMIKIGYGVAPKGFPPDHEMTRLWERWLRLLQQERELSEATESDTK